MFHSFRGPAPLVLAALAAPPVLAQGPAFETPGMPRTLGRPDAEGQTSRFSSEFNPAFSFIVDAEASWLDVGGRSAGDGLDARLRVFELGANAWVDPNAWAYFVAAADEEEVTLEEAALHYVGFEGNSTLRIGRFFVDFGKQMQVHVHELRTVERPLVLRAYLGEEVKGDGLQWDHWIPVGDATVVRWSLGAFANLLPEEDEFGTGVEREVAERKDLEDLNFTARLTGFADVSERGTLQVGTSAQLIPDYSVTFAATGDVAGGLSRQVYGLDVTYGHVDATGQERWTAGAELLVSAGDNGALNPTPGSVAVLDDAVSGLYAFVDYAWDARHSAGLQYSAVELPDGRDTELVELELYATRQLSEFQRMRLALRALDHEREQDEVGVVLQYTAVLGAHGHGLAW